METGRKSFSEAKKGHSIRKCLDPNVEHCLKLRKSVSVESYWIRHEGSSWGREGSQILEKYSQEILTEGFDLLEKFDSLGIEKRLEKLLRGLGAPGEGKETAAIRERLKMHTDE